MGNPLVIAVRSSIERETKLAHVHEQSEFTYGVYLVAAGQIEPDSFVSFGFKVFERSRSESSPLEKHR